MAIASEVIACVPVSGSRADRISMAFLSEWADAAERFVVALEQPYALRLGTECRQCYGNELVERQVEQAYGVARSVVGHEQFWASKTIIKVSLVSPYGTKCPTLWAFFHYGDGPVQVQHEQPITFILDAWLAAEWTLMEVVKSQCSQAWTSTTPVVAQGVFRWDCLERDPVAAAFAQIWNLSDDRAIRFAGAAARAFHAGELV